MTFWDHLHKSETFVQAMQAFHLPPTKDIARLQLKLTLIRANHKI
jgi:hypothetical protein